MATFAIHPYVEALGWQMLPWDDVDPSNERAPRVWGDSPVATVVVGDGIYMREVDLWVDTTDAIVWSWGECGSGPPPELLTSSVGGGTNNRCAFVLNREQSGIWTIVAKSATGAMSSVPLYVVVVGEHGTGSVLADPLALFGADLHLWYTLTAEFTDNDGQVIFSATDRSGNGRTGTAVADREPALSSVNGAEAALFSDATETRIDQGLAADWAFLHEESSLVAFSAVASSTKLAYVVSTDAYGSTDGGAKWIFPGGAQVNGAGTVYLSSYSVTGDTVPSGSAAAHVTAFDDASDSLTTEIYLPGGNVRASRADTTTSGSKYIGSDLALMIGGPEDADNNDRFFDGHIRDVVIVRANVPEVLRRRLGRWLADGITYG